MIRTQDHTSLKCRKKWVEDVGEINDNQWEAALKAIPVVSLSASQRLSQLFILHRAYRTPVQLHRWGGRDSSACPKCGVHRGDFIHLMWRCPKLHRYWEEVSRRISGLAQIHIPLNPTVYFLGAIEAEMFPGGKYLMITRLMYLARKLIARYWMTPTVPTGKQWISYVNSLLPRERLAYNRRNDKGKFDKIW